MKLQEKLHIPSPIQPIRLSWILMICCWTFKGWIWSQVGKDSRFKLLNHILPCFSFILSNFHLLGIKIICFLKDCVNCEKMVELPYKLLWMKIDIFLWTEPSCNLSTFRCPIGVGYHFVWLSMNIESASTLLFYFYFYVLSSW